MFKENPEGGLPLVITRGPYTETTIQPGQFLDIYLGPRHWVEGYYTPVHGEVDLKVITSHEWQRDFMPERSVFVGLVEGMPVRLRTGTHEIYQERIQK
jgi:hypothetical protein